MSVLDDLSAAEAELKKLRHEHDTLKMALGDPELVTWVSGYGPMPRRLTAFELATVKRLKALLVKLEAAEDEYEELLADVVCGLSGMEHGEPDDPEVLLKASMVTIAKLHKAGTSTVESRATLKVLIRYLKSLATDEDYF